jgi:hypothetical protein
MTGLLDLFTIIYDPPAVFERVREKPRFWMPFLGLAILQIIVAVLMMPYTRAAMSQIMQARGATPGSGAFAVFGIIFAPIGIAIPVLASAAILWMLLSVMAGEARFRSLLSVATYAGLTFVIAQLAGFAVLATGGGPSRVTSMADLRPAFGLDLLAPSASFAVQTFLGAFNPFSIWGLVLTGLGVAITHKTSKGTAFSVAFVALIVGAVIAAGFSMLAGPRGV